MCVKLGSINIAGTSLFIMFENFQNSSSLKLKQWDMGMGHLLCKGVGQLWQSELLFFWEMCSKITGIQGSTLSSHCMTTGFGPFELLTCGLLQKGQDHSLPKAFFE